MFDLCRFGASGRLPFVQQRYAEVLEAEGNFEQAEVYYLRAGKAQEAVMMHLHNKNWDAAERIAKDLPPEVGDQPGQPPAIALVHVHRARAALDQKDFRQAEGYLLRANRTDLALAYYRDANMWTDALRIAREYVLGQKLPYKNI